MLMTKEEGEDIVRVRRAEFEVFNVIPLTFRILISEAGLDEVK